MFAFLEILPETSTKSNLAKSKFFLVSSTLSNPVEPFSDDDLLPIDHISFTIFSITLLIQSAVASSSGNIYERGTLMMEKPDALWNYNMTQETKIGWN